MVEKRYQLRLAGPFAAIHCILHQEALCGKSLQLKNVMDVVVKTMNLLRARGLNHRQFVSFLGDLETEYGELLYHTENITVEPQLLKDYVDILSRLLEDFEHRFQLFPALEPQFFLVATPFAVEVKNVPEEVQMELLDLQCDSVLKQK
uniref:Uncharacterized protein n=1 Tax=Biomphalaria glabrata TaxID=6526 RepID=A0A2C9M951_BIOGL